MDYESFEDMIENQWMEDSMTVVEYSHDEQGHRVDVHRPSAINPGDYEYVQVNERRKEGALRVDGTGYTRGGPAGICHHCGKAIVWEVWFNHKPTNRVVHFGYQCAEFLLLTDNRIDHEMNLLKRTAANERQQEEWAKQTADRRADWEANYPDEAAFVRDYKGEFGQDFINRLRWGIDKYGSPLEDSIASLKKFIAGRQAFEDRKLEEAKVLENAPLLGEGRQTITGTIVSTKYVDNPYGDARIHKMLVRMDDGNKVYGTVPNVIDSHATDLKDVRVRFDAKVEPKEDHFGFFSRPTKSQVI